jgi:hypothetical protein
VYIEHQRDGILPVRSFSDWQRVCGLIRHLPMQPIRRQHLQDQQREEGSVGTTNFVISGLMHKGYVERMVNGKTAGRAIDTLAVEPGLSTWFGLGQGGVNTSQLRWQADHLATSVFYLEGT